MKKLFIGYSSGDLVLKIHETSNMYNVQSIVHVTYKIKYFYTIKMFGLIKKFDGFYSDIKCFEL